MKYIASILILSSLSLLSCNKEPGQGGTSSITGKVFAYDLNSTGLITLDQFYVMDEDVYIIYGNETATYSDKFSTSYDGSYRFDNLTVGTYEIFTYSRCDTCSDQLEVIKTEVDVTEKGTEYSVSDLIIFK